MRLLTCLLISVSVASSVLASDPPCVWSSASGAITETCGKLGIGTTAPADSFHVFGSSPNMRLEHSSPTTAQSMLAFYEGTSMYGFINQRGSAYAGQPAWFNIGNSNTNGALSLYAGGNLRVFLAADGSVGIGTTTPIAKLDVAGNLNVSGDITGARVFHAVFQDLAEWVPSTESLAPGTVVVLDRSVPNRVTPSRGAYDTSVAGVVSASPGIILGQAATDRERIATTGRVKVRVNASRTPIRIGDLLVTSNDRGVAMKSEPIDIGGAEIHRPGTIIGKALEPLGGGTGQILVLLSLQ